MERSVSLVESEYQRKVWKRVEIEKSDGYLREGEEKAREKSEENNV